MKRLSKSNRPKVVVASVCAYTCLCTVNYPAKLIKKTGHILKGRDGKYDVFYYFIGEFFLI
jgi:hypothetical protein